MSFGERLRKLRIDSNLKQQDIADKLKISRSTYTNYENSERFPSIESLILIADLFKVSLDFLVRGKYESVFSMNTEVIVNLIPVITSELKGNYSIKDNYEYLLPAILDTDEADKYFYFKVNHESMCNSNILMDSLILFYEQLELEPNSLGLFQIQNKHMVLGKVQVIDNKILLKPINPSYEVLLFDSNDISHKRLLILGKAISITQNITNNIAKKLSIDNNGDKNVDHATKGIIDVDDNCIERIEDIINNQNDNY